MTLRRLESEDGEEFWEVWVTDLTLSCRYGKVGTSGQTDHEKFWTRAEARAVLEERLEEKFYEGFIEIEVEPPKPPAESNTFAFFFVCVFFLTLAIMLPARPGPSAKYGRPSPRAMTPDHPYPAGGP